MDRPSPAADRIFDRVERVRAHIHANLDAPLDLDALAEVACLSRFHWHRVYRAVTGETAAQTVKRLRLARAAGELAHTDAPVAEIARRAGYTTQSAFTRAFAAAHGAPPAEFRVKGGHAVLAQATEEKNAMAFPIEIRELPERAALGLLHEGPYPEIGRTFERLTAELGRHGLFPRVRGMFGLYQDDPSVVAPADLRSYACAFVDAPLEAPAPLEALTAGGGTYAVLLYKGPYTAMQPAYDWLYGTWLAQSGRTPRDGPCLEVNLNTPDQAPPSELLTEICVPLEAG